MGATRPDQSTSTCSKVNNVVLPNRPLGRFSAYKSTGNNVTCQLPYRNSANLRTQSTVSVNKIRQLRQPTSGSDRMQSPCCINVYSKQGDELTSPDINSANYNVQESTKITGLNKVCNTDNAEWSGLYTSEQPNNMPPVTRQRSCSDNQPSQPTSARDVEQSSQRSCSDNHNQSSQPTSARDVEQIKQDNAAVQITVARQANLLVPGMLNNQVNAAIQITVISQVNLPRLMMVINSQVNVPVLMRVINSPVNLPVL